MTIDSPVTEHDLIELSRQGDQRAFAELVGRHQNRAWAVCLQMTGNQHDAEDALQNALLAAWQNLYRFRGDARFSTWLHRIAVNAALQVIRRRRETVADPADLADIQRDAASLPDARVVDVDAVQRALAELPEDARVAIVLREFADMSYDDIAEHQKISLNAVKSRIHRARNMLLQNPHLQSVRP